MMSPRSPFGASNIEVLEARIAPATINAGAPNSLGGNDTDYDESPFVSLMDAGPDDLIAQSLLRGDAPVPNTYYLRLSGGDKLKIYNGSNSYDDFLVVDSGNVIAFFVDGNGNNEVEEGELVSLSVGKNASFSLASGIAGDIVGNLDEKGTKNTADDELDMSGLVSGKQSIKSIKVGNGDISGQILAGGDIKKVTVNGRVGSILSGTATNGESFDFFPGTTIGKGTVSFTAADGAKGGSIQNVLIDAIGFNPNEGRIEAGAGGAGAAGGSLKNIQISDDIDGFTLKAGDGGSALGRAKAGAGGNVSSVYISGVLDGLELETRNNLIGIYAGDGGDSAEGNGGKGGDLSKVFVGYSLVGKKALASTNKLLDNVEMGSGAGGDGRIGGAGGKISTVNVLISAPDLAGADEISVIAGNGGDNTVATGGKAGVGGSISNVNLSDLSLELGTTITVKAGDGGSAAVEGKGAKGGSISKSTFLASGLFALAGNGSAGTVGGAGGSLTDLKLDQSEGVIPHVALFNAGFGGNGTAGNGGKGGNIVSLRVTEGDFTQFDINSGAAADGGSSVGGKGGKGGDITKMDVVDNDLANGNFIGEANVRAGNGGSGTKGGGAGGAIKSSLIVSEDIDLNLRTGNGGSAAVDGNGRGGAGGVIQKSQFIILGDSDIDVPASVAIATGVGGDGVGGKGIGGNGGNFTSVLMRAKGSISATAGNGGSGGDDDGVGNAAGKGGSFLRSGAFATLGDGALIAGNGGVEGTKPGNGGSIIGNSSKLTGLYAAGALTLLAGNGTNGGAGGSIVSVGYGSTEPDLTPTPTGNILVKAGDGSGEGRFAGVGGSIKNLTGAVSSSSGTETLIYGGVGGGTDQKSANGGSIVDVRIERGGSPVDAPLTELKILAGDAGNGGAGVSKGANGGDVRNVRIFNLSDPNVPPPGVPTDTLIRSIAAGRGGDATNVGGKGGTLDKVRALDHDIGVRFGEAYGYDTMGGLFAGEGGSASSADGRTGKSGNVTNITAKAISAIVAGRGAMPSLVEKVENVYLFSSSAPRGVDLLELEPDPLNPLSSDLDRSENLPSNPNPGDLRFAAFNPAAYFTNNFVGAVVNPFDIDGNKFRFNDTNQNGEWDFDEGETPIDGLIAAKVFKQTKVNFTPEARLIGATLDAAEFYDYDNRKDTPAV